MTPPTNEELTASEKLKALDADWRERNFGEYGWHEPCVLGGDEIQRDYQTIGELLPALIAVVEAAHRAHDEPHDFAAGVGWRTMGEALAALDEALGADQEGEA